MTKMRWFDCDGVELHDGDIIQDLETGELERVFECHPVDSPYDTSLGVNASNEGWLKLHSDHSREIYPFSNFSYKFVDGERHLVSYRLYEKAV